MGECTSAEFISLSIYRRTTSLVKRNNLVAYAYLLSGGDDC